MASDVETSPSFIFIAVLVVVPSGDVYFSHISMMQSEWRDGKKEGKEREVYR